MITTIGKFQRAVLVAGVTVIVAAGAGCHHGDHEDNTRVRDAIAAADKDIADAVARGDAAAVTAHYTADAMIAPPSGDVVSGGAENIQKFWQGAIDGGLKGVELSTTNLDTYRHVAYQLGKFTAKGADGAVLGTGKYLVIWRKDHTRNEWQIHRDIWNDAPAAPAAAAAPPAAPAAPPK
jgi:ketosteroid isomerase-like protein